MKDKTGKQEIEVGSYILYATTFLKFGKVVAVYLPKEPDAFQKKGDYSYRVVGIDDNWGHCDPELCKPGTLLYENRIVVLPFEMLPDYAQKFLKDL